MIEQIQVVAIANAFELVYEHELPYATLTDLAKADESHFGQKATFWTTRYGFPKVVICTSRPSDSVLNRIYESVSPPSFIEPKRMSSSICADLLGDKSAIESFLSLLDLRRGVFLAPYVHTPQFEALAMFLVKAGFRLVDFHNQSKIVKSLWSKTEAQHLVFEAVDILIKHRPESLVAESDDALVKAIMQCAGNGIRKVVVKSATAVGGSGVFYIDSFGVSKDMIPADFLLGEGQNEPNRSAPFIVEEHVHWDVSPTVDIDISKKGQVDFIGVGLQRLHDRRYYNGFYSSTLLEQRWWFKTVESVAMAVGTRLFALGYVGPANIDFVVSSEHEQITLIEVNPRRSALIDGYGLRKLKYNSIEEVSVSAADYVNISEEYDNLDDAFDALSLNAWRGGEILPFSDGGFSSSYRWTGILAIGQYPADSEDILAESVTRLQDPSRDETGSAGERLRTFNRISQDTT